MRTTESSGISTGEVRQQDSPTFYGELNEQSGETGSSSLDESAVDEAEIWRTLKELGKEGTKGEARKKFLFNFLKRGLDELKQLGAYTATHKEARHPRLGERVMKRCKAMRL